MLGESDHVLWFVTSPFEALFSVLFVCQQDYTKTQVTSMKLGGNTGWAKEDPIEYWCRPG